MICINKNVRWHNNTIIKNTDLSFIDVSERDSHQTLLNISNGLKWSFVIEAHKNRNQ